MNHLILMLIGLTLSSLSLANEACHNRYKENWSKTLKIIDDKTINCWNPEQTQIIQENKEAINNSLKGESWQTIIPKYHEIQNWLSYCRASDLIKTQTPLPTMGRLNLHHKTSMLIHILGDSYGRHTGFEGRSGVEHFFVRQDMMQQMLNLKENTYIADIKQADPCHDIDSFPKYTDSIPNPDLSIETLKDFISSNKTASELTKLLNGSFDPFYDKFKENIDYLKDGKKTRFFMQGGWVQHAVVFEIRMHDSETFKFRVFNSGDGLAGHHINASISGTNKYFPYIEKIDVSEFSITNFFFLNEILRLNKTERKNNQSNSKDLYNLVKYSLDGQFTTRQPEAGDFASPQISGTCAYFSIPYYYSTIIKDSNISDILEFNFKLKYLDEYFNQLEQILNTKQAENIDATTIEVVHKSLFHFYDLNNELKIQLADDGLKILVSESLDRYRAILKNIDALLQKKLTKKIEDIKEQTTIRTEDKDHEIEFTTTNETKQAKINFLRLDKDNLAKSLNNIIKTINDSNLTNARIQDSLNTLLEIILEIPLDSKYWSANQVNHEEILDSLVNLNILFMEISGLDRKNKRNIHSIEWAAQIKILTIADIIRSFQTNPAIKINTLHISHISSYLGEESLLAFYDPNWNNEFTKIQHHWKTQDKKDSDFFKLIDGDYFVFESKTDWQLTDLSEDRSIFLDYPKTIWPAFKEMRNFLKEKSGKTTQTKEVLEYLKEYDPNLKFKIDRSFYHFRAIQYLTKKLPHRKSGVTYTHSFIHVRCLEREDPIEYLECDIYSTSNSNNKLTEKNIDKQLTNGMIEDKISSLIFSSHSNRDSKPENKQITKIHKKIEKLRNLANLNITKGDTITETIGFFNENYDLLQYPEYQFILKSNIFAPGAIKKDLYKNTFLLNNLAKFCLDNYKKAIKRENTLLASYFLYISSHIKEIILRDTEHKTPDLSLFPNSNTKLIELIEKTTKPATKMLLLKDLTQILTYKNNLNEDDVKWLLIGYIYSQNQTKEKSYLSYFHKHKEKIKNFLEKNTDPLHKVSEHFNLSHESHWESNYPIYSSSESKINVYTAEISRQGSTLITLPKEIYNNNHFKKLIKWNDGLVLKNGNIFELSNNKNELYRIRKIKIKKRTETKTETKTEFFKKIGKDWFLYEPNHKEHRMFHTWKKITFSNQSTPNLTEERQYTKLFFRQTQSDIAMIQITDKNKKSKIFKAENINHPSDITLNNTNPIRLSSFEENSYIYTWNLDKDTKLIELPRLKLKFTLKGNKLTHEKFGEYIDPVFNKLNKAVNILTFKKGSKITLLVARRPMGKSDQKPEIKKLYTYKYDPQKNRLISINNSQKLFLAYLLTFNKKYNLARETLEELTPLTSPLILEDREVISWFLNINDGDPRHIAVALYSLSIAAQYIESLDLPNYFDEKEIKLIARMLTDYNSVKHKLAKNWFPANREALIRDSLRIPQLSANTAIIPKYKKSGITFSYSYLHFGKPNHEDIEKLIAKGRYLDNKIFLYYFNEFYSIVYGYNFNDVGKKIENLFIKIGIPIKHRLFKSLFYTYLRSAQVKNSKHAALLLFLLEEKKKFRAIPMLAEIKKEETRKNLFKTQKNIEISSEEYDLKAQEPLNTTSEEKEEQLDIKYNKSFKGSDYSLHSPIISEEEMRKIIKNKKVGLEKLVKKKSNKALKEIFELPNLTPLEENTFKHIIKKIENRATLQSKRKPKTIGDVFALRTAFDTLKTKENQSLTAFKNHKANIIKLAKKLPEDWFNQAKFKIKSAHKERFSSTLDILIKYYATEDIEKIVEINPYLSKQETAKLWQEIQEYLLSYTFYKKVNNILDTITNVEERHFFKDLEVKNFIESATQIRAYDAIPSFLAFEYFMGFIIREKQYKAIFELLNSNNSLYELIMGSGKTSVILTLFSLLNSNKNNLNIIILPQALIASVGMLLSEQMFKVFGRIVEVIDIQRKHKYNPVKLEKIYKRLKTAHEEKKTIIMSSSSVQSLFLLYIQAVKLKNYKHNIQYNKIFNLLKEHGTAIIDEIDMIMDVTMAHIFSENKDDIINQDALLGSLGLYKLIIANKDIRSKVNLPFLKSSEGREFTKDYYNKEIKNELINAIASEKAAKPLFYHGLLNSEKGQFKKLDFEALKNFLHSSDPEETNTYLQSIKNEFLRGILACLHSQLHIFLPITFSKKYLVNYGLFPKEHCIPKEYCPEHIAIPYRSGQPFIESRFGDMLESINYTIQSHLINKSQFRALVFEHNFLKKALEKNSSDSHRKKIMNLASHWFGDIHSKDFIDLDLQEIFDYSKKITEPEDILKLITKPLKAQLKIFRTQIQTNPFIFHFIFKEVRGLTGTLWNKNAMSKDLNKTFPGDGNYPSGTLEETIMLLWKKSNQRSNKKIELLDVESTDEISKKLNTIDIYPQYRSIIDQAGLFKEVKDNYNIAKTILDSKTFQSSVNEHIIYYDKMQRIKVLSKDNKISSYDPMAIDREKTIAIWDIKHTTGSDLKISKSAKAIIIVGKDTILRDIMQSAWRLRDLNNNQKVDFAIIKDDYSYIKEYLSKKGVSSEKLHLKHLFIYSIFNEIEDLNNQTFKSIAIQMKLEIIKKIFSKILKEEYVNLKSSPEASFFFSQIPELSYNYYGKPVQVLSSEKAVHLEKEKILHSLTNSNLNTDQTREAMQKIIDERINLLQPTINFIGSSAGLSIEVEAETETELNIRQNISKVNINLKFHEQNRISWNQKNFFEGGCFKSPFTQEDSSSLEKHPCIRLSKALELDERLTLKDAFSEKILISLNATPLKKIMDVKEDEEDKDFEKFKLFSEFHKSLNNILIIFDPEKENSILAMVIIDVEDAYELGIWLTEDVLAPLSKHEHKLGFAIYHLGGQFHQHNKNMNQKDFLTFYNNLKNNPNFIELITQIKFFAGKVKYTENELKYMKNWLSKNPKIIDVFSKDILKFREDSNVELDGSELHELFTDIKLKHEDTLQPE